MRSRFPSTSGISYSFGPGPLTPAIKVIIGVNVVAFLATLLDPSISLYLGLRPADVVDKLRVWQLVTYMFIHAGPTYYISLLKEYPDFRNNFQLT